MKFIDELNDLKKKQNDILVKYNNVIKEAEKSDNLIENEKLKKEVNRLRKDLDEISVKYNKIKKDNKNLKLTLNEQIIDEKLNILKISQDKLEIYFGREKGKYQNNLKVLENNIKNKINKYKNITEKQLKEDKDEIYREINELENKLSKKIKEHREKILLEEEAILADMKKGINQYSDKNIDEETIKKRVKQNKIEMKIGLTWLNRIGVFLILIAIGITAYYNRNSPYFNSYVKGILFFSAGIAALVLGEFFYRKQKEAFSLGLLGGGIAILYSAIFFSYFVLKYDGNPIIGTYTAMILSVIVSLTAIILAIRYNSRTVISIGLIGGYLPFLSYIFAFGFNGYEFHYAMGYLFLLNLLVLIISLYKQWRLSNYISFILNVPSLIYLVLNAPNYTISLVFSILTFIMYLVIILGYPLKYKKGLNPLDLILIGLNTLISSLLIFAIAHEMGLKEWRVGILALGFCIIYSGLGYLTNKLMKEEKGSAAIFYLTALTFAVLMIPFTLGEDQKHWFSLGWLIEGVLLTIYGYKKSIKPAEIAGWIIFGICLLNFYYLNFIVGYIFRAYKVEYLTTNFFFIITGSVLTTLIYQLDIKNNKLSEFSLKSKFVKGFKYFTIGTFYVFLIYITQHYFDKMYHNLIIIKNLDKYGLYSFYQLIIFAIVTLGLGLLLSKIKLIHDKAVKVFSIVLYITGDLLCFIIILFKPIMRYSLFNFQNNNYIVYISLALLVIYNIIVIFSIKDLILTFIKYTKQNLELYPLWISIILFGNITAFILRQLHLENARIYLVFTYLILAFICMIYGFKKRQIYIRFFGLGLTFFALILLFFRILLSKNVDTVWKIVAFFGFGILLIIISYIYQVVNKSIQKKGE